MGALKPVGRATAIGRGHYPLADGRHKVMLPGETFTLWEGLEKGTWFTRGTKSAPAASADPPAPAEPATLAEAAKAERKRKAEVKPPLGDSDIV